MRALTAVAATALTNMSQRHSRDRTTENPPAAASRIDPEDTLRSYIGGDIPLPPGRQGRGVTQNVGVWSSFGQVFHSHGHVELNLGRKPQPATTPWIEEKPKKKKKVPIFTKAKPPPPAAPPKKLPPVFNRGLGLGLGLQPQRFPRELLKSSEGRLVRCHAGLENALSSSASEPALLTREFIDGTSATDPVRRLFGAAPTHALYEELDEEDPDAPPPPPIDPQILLRRRSTDPIVEVPSPTRREMGAKVIKGLPLGPRCQAEFKNVQRESRLKLQEALAERQRIRDSVFALRHAHVGLGPMVLNKKPGGRFGTGGNKLPNSQSEPTLQPNPIFASAASPAKSVIASRQPTGSLLQPSPMRTGVSFGKAAEPPPVVAPVPPANPLGRLSQPTLWHMAAESISESDGGSLRLWQALKERAATQKLPVGVESGEAIELLDEVFDKLRVLLEEAQLTVGAELVEEMFRQSSSHCIRREGGREILMPMLKCAAEFANIPSEEVRRMTVQYCYPPPEGHSKDPSPHGMHGRRVSNAADAGLRRPSHRPGDLTLPTMTEEGAGGGAGGEVSTPMKMPTMAEEEEEGEAA